MIVNVLIFLVTASLAGYGAVRYVRGSRREELPAFVVLMSSVTLWESVILFIRVNTAPALKLAGYNGLNAFVIPVAVYALVWFTLVYVDVERWVLKGVSVVSVVQIVTTAVAFTIAPEFMYTADGVVSRGPVTVLTVTFQQWVVLERTPNTLFFLFQLYIFSILASLVVVFVYHAVRLELPLGQALAMSVGISAPGLSTILTRGVGVLPPGLDIADAALGVSSVALAVAVFRYRLLEFKPLGRKQVAERIPDPVVLLDEDDRVVDSNPAARALVDAPADWQQMAVTQFFTPLSECIEQLQSADAVGTVISIEQDTRTRHFDVSISLVQRTSTQQGRLVYFREITAPKRREQSLQTIQSAMRSFVTVDSPPELVQRLVTRAAETTGARYVGVWRHNPAEQQLQPTAMTTDGKELFGSQPTFEHEDSIIWNVFSDGEARLVEDVTAEDDAYNPDSPIRSEMIVPLRGYGVLAVGSKRPDNFTREEFETLQTFVTSAESALRTARTQR